MSEGAYCDGGCEPLDQLRRELTEKHAQNRSDIHRLSDDQQRLILEVAELKGKILPIVGNGQPGILAQISTKLDELADDVTELRIAQGADTGRRGEHEWLRAVIASAVIGFLLIVAQHVWK